MPMMREGLSHRIFKNLPSCSSLPSSILFLNTCLFEWRAIRRSLARRWHGRWRRTFLTTKIARVLACELVDRCRLFEGDLDDRRCHTRLFALPPKPELLRLAFPRTIVTPRRQ